jgi:hypothetical protein
LIERFRYDLIRLMSREVIPFPVEKVKPNQLSLRHARSQAFIYANGKITSLVFGEENAGEYFSWKEAIDNSLDGNWEPLRDQLLDEAKRINMESWYLWSGGKEIQLRKVREAEDVFNLAQRVSPKIISLEEVKNLIALTSRRRKISTR